MFGWILHPPKLPEPPAPPAPPASVKTLTLAEAELVLADFRRHHLEGARQALEDYCAADARWSMQLKAYATDYNRKEREMEDYTSYSAGKVGRNGYVRAYLDKVVAPKINEIDDRLRNLEEDEPMLTATQSGALKRAEEDARKWKCLFIAMRDKYAALASRGAYSSKVGEKVVLDSRGSTHRTDAASVAALAERLIETERREAEATALGSRRFREAREWQAKYDKLAAAVSALPK